jgi:hypothetical protein
MRLSVLFKNIVLLKVE